MSWVQSCCALLCLLQPVLAKPQEVSTTLAPHTPTSVLTRSKAASSYSKTECPTCQRASFTCSYGYCGSACTGDQGKVYNPIALDFRYRHPPGSCVEQFALDGLSMLQDFDIWCMDPRTKSYIDTSNMHQYVAHGVALLSGCSASANAHDLIEETCGWAAKNMRPVLRCKYRLWPSLGKTEWAVESCMLLGHCTKYKTERIDVTCRSRIPPSSKVTALEEQIASLTEQLAATEEANLAGLETELQDTQQQLVFMQAAYERANEADLQKHPNISRNLVMMAELDESNKKLKKADKDLFKLVHDAESLQEEEEPLHEYVFNQWYIVVGASLLISACIVVLCGHHKSVRANSILDDEVDAPPGQNDQNDNAPPYVFVVNSQAPAVDGSVVVVGRPVPENTPLRLPEEVAGGHASKPLRSTAQPTALEEPALEEPDLEQGTEEDSFPSIISSEATSSSSTRRSGRKLRTVSRRQTSEDTRTPEMFETSQPERRVRRQTTRPRVQKRSSGTISAEESNPDIDLRRASEPSRLSVKEQRAMGKQLKSNKARRNTTTDDSSERLEGFELPEAPFGA